MATRDTSKEDDFVEMHVAPAEPQAQPAPAQPRQPRRRASNPQVDDVIHTGEIQPRSMIVRSTDSSPRIEVAKIEIQDEKTELAAPLAVPAPRSRSWLLLAAAAIPAAAAVALLFVGSGTGKGAPRAAPPVDDGAKTAI